MQHASDPGRLRLDRILGPAPKQHTMKERRRISGARCAPSPFATTATASEAREAWEACARPRSADVGTWDEHRTSVARELAAGLLRCAPALWDELSLRHASRWPHAASPACAHVRLSPRCHSFWAAARHSQCWFRKHPLQGQRDAAQPLAVDTFGPRDTSVRVVPRRQMLVRAALQCFSRARPAELRSTKAPFCARTRPRATSAPWTARRRRPHWYRPQLHGKQAYAIAMCSAAVRGAPCGSDPASQPRLPDKLLAPFCSILPS
jgi:hypothetical protein